MGYYNFFTTPNLFNNMNFNLFNPFMNIFSGFSMFNLPFNNLFNVGNNYNQIINNPFSMGNIGYTNYSQPMLFDYNNPTNLIYNQPSQNIYNNILSGSNNIMGSNIENRLEQNLKYGMNNLILNNTWQNMGLDLNSYRTQSNTNTDIDTDTNVETKTNKAKSTSKTAVYGTRYTAISDKVKEYGANAKYIEKLHPAMQEKVMKLLDWAKSEGIKITITSGFRSGEQQSALQYKNKNGKKVAAAPGSSPHEYGIALDFKSSNNEKVGKYARDVLGMRWGGDWGKRKGGWSRETWHIDMANTIKKVHA